MLDSVIVGAGAVGLMPVCESAPATQALMSRFTPVSGSRSFK